MSNQIMAFALANAGIITDKMADRTERQVVLEKAISRLEVRLHDAPEPKKSILTRKLSVARKALLTFSRS